MGGATGSNVRNSFCPDNCPGSRRNRDHSLERSLITLEKDWSEWQDLNLRPPRPERGALPDCATLRLKAGLITRVRERPQAIDPNDRAGGGPIDKGKGKRDHAQRARRRTGGARARRPQRRRP